MSCYLYAISDMMTSWWEIYENYFQSYSYKYASHKQKIYAAGQAALHITVGINSTRVLPHMESHGLGLHWEIYKVFCSFMRLIMYRHITGAELLAVSLDHMLWLFCSFSRCRVVELSPKKLSWTKRIKVIIVAKPSIVFF